MGYVALFKGTMSEAELHKSHSGTQLDINMVNQLDDAVDSLQVPELVTKGKKHPR